MVNDKNEKIIIEKMDSDTFYTTYQRLATLSNAEILALAYHAFFVRGSLHDTALPALVAKLDPQMINMKLHISEDKICTTLLHTAAQEGREEFVALLLANGADPQTEVEMKLGGRECSTSAVGVACYNGYLLCVEVFAKSGAVADATWKAAGRVGIAPYVPAETKDRIREYCRPDADARARCLST